MKLLANLYLVELQPSREVFTFKRVMAATVALFVVAVVASVGATFYANQQQIQTQRLVHEFSQAQQELTRIREELRAATNNAQLAQQISDVEMQLGQRQRLLQQMQQVTLSSQVSFASLLQDIARADVESIWLQRILVANNQLTLQGKTTNAGALPQWLASFSDYSALSNRQFGVFELRDTPGSGVLDFTVGSLQHSSLLTQPSRNSGASR